MATITNPRPISQGGEAPIPVEPSAPVTQGVTPIPVEPSAPVLPVTQGVTPLVQFPTVVSTSLPSVTEPTSLPSVTEPPAFLWNQTNAIAFLIVFVIILLSSISGISAIFNIQNIKDNWANYRCNPLIMPFTGLFGYNTSENFEFCMGKIFSTHSAESMDSIGSVFGSFSTILTSVFGSINSLRNTIATLGGGINVVFQEFTDRITMFFFTLRMNAIRLKMMFGRIYALLFSVMYMGMSGISGMSSFTNTFLFSFLDTFCFPGSTEIMVKRDNNLKMTPIKDIKIGDILLPGKCAVTATFSFYAKGQPMVKLGNTIVSTNHYVLHEGRAIKVEDHPMAVSCGVWDSDDYLYCLNTDNHIIPVGLLQFLDYDETSAADGESMRMIEQRINNEPSITIQKPYPFTECGFGIAEDACIWISTKDGNKLLKSIKKIQVGDTLSTGSHVVGLIRKQITECCVVDGIEITPSTLFWNGTKWIRFGEVYPVKITSTCTSVALIVTPNSQIELENGMYVRDYMELCSPDAEMYYTQHLEKKGRS